MQKITSGSVAAWSDAACLHNNNIVLLSMFGPRNSVRSLWSKLADRKRQFVSAGDDQFVDMESGVNYVTLRSTMSRQMLHMVILHPAATHQCSPFANSFFQVGPDPSLRFFSRLNRMSPIPFRNEWREYLWHRGQGHGLIKPLTGWDMPGFKIDAGEAWADVVKEGIMAGELK